MVWLTLIKAFLGKNWMLIAAITAALAVYGYQKIEINRLESKLEDCELDKKKALDRVDELTTLNTTLEGKIVEQNKSIEIANEKFKSLQASIAKTEASNARLKKENDRLKADIESRPIPKTCGDAATELKDTMVDIAKKWNKQ